MPRWEFQLCCLKWGARSSTSIPSKPHCSMQGKDCFNANILHFIATFTMCHLCYIKMWQKSNVPLQHFCSGRYYSHLKPDPTDVNWHLKSEYLVLISFTSLHSRHFSFSYHMDGPILQLLNFGLKSMRLSEITLKP